MYLVRAGLPPDARRLAAERGYLPDGVPLVKRIAALEGDRVCALDDAVSVNGRVAAKRQARDRLGRPLPRWTGRHVPADDELFLLMAAVPSSFVGRNFGLVPPAAILVRLAPLWTDCLPFCSAHPLLRPVPAPFPTFSNWSTSPRLLPTPA